MTITQFIEQLEDIRMTYGELDVCARNDDGREIAQILVVPDDNGKPYVEVS
jgi:hypothetical protein